ncbi:heme-binding protein 2 [Antennarius striatus]|uniref:heme-binding protein 2 n=1 Tax=Antennarius striatus TaxID=241820 RepID=UPI0035B4C432
MLHLRLHLFGLIGFLLVLTTESRVGDSSQLPFCSETQQCLLFDLMCKTDQYEVRHYESVKWVTTEEASWFMETASMGAFWRLYQYISDNRIDMTSPVIIKINHTEPQWWMPKFFSMSFLLPAEHQKNPPKPTNDQVRIVEMPDMKVYVKSYSGWMTTASDSYNADQLPSALPATAKYNKAYHYAAGYNSPMTMLNRHNEVWFVAEGEAECSSSEESSMETD